MGHDIFNDSVLGKLEWDEWLEWWRGQIRFAPDHDITLSIHGHDLEAILEARRDTFMYLRDHESGLRTQVAEQMLEMAEDWRDEDEEPDPITLESFTSRVRLESIVLYDDGSAELYYNDDDIFAAHTIVASVNADGKLEKATIAG
jgi:hypothetical protein